jgi:hypothetical protein
MHITDLESAMILHIAENEYGDCPEDATWTQIVCETSEDKGVLSSLSKKGLVSLQGHGREATVQLTAEGLKVYYEGQLHVNPDDPRW